MLRPGLLSALFLALVAYATAPAVVTREVRFGRGDRLAGQIDKPAGLGPFPLVILIPGAGLDRTGRSSRFTALAGIYVPLVDIAVGNGWAMFRYDRAGSGMSLASGGDEVAGAVDAVRTARELPGVDTERVVIVAHASGTLLFAKGYDRFEELIGYRAIKGTVLLSSKVGAQTAGRMPGDLLIAIGQSVAATDSPVAAGAVSAHRRFLPERNADAMVLQNCDYALCDTTAPSWSGWSGAEGSCAIPGEAYAAVERFLQRIHRDRR